LFFLKGLKFCEDVEKKEKCKMVEKMELFYECGGGLLRERKRERERNGIV
jgi:hypothetical protein